MTALDHNPQTLNLLSSYDFVMNIKRCPNVKFFAQKINVPGISGESVGTPTPLATIKRTYDHIQFHPLVVTCSVDEKFANYLEIHNWIRALGPTVDFTGRQRLTRQAPVSGLGLTSEINLMLLSSNKNPIISVVFQDAFPVELSDIYFETVGDGKVNYITMTATFDYTLYNIETL